jgi:hypothetical protein
LSAVLPPPAGSGDLEVDEPDPDCVPQDLFYKRDLLRRVCEEEIPEPWVRCDACQGWFHQACRLFNGFHEQGLARRCHRRRRRRPPALADRI